eukprot:364866-Chlamydomonas_euryale.AAC.8
MAHACGRRTACAYMLRMARSCEQRNAARLLAARAACTEQVVVASVITCCMPHPMQKHRLW